MSEEEKVVWGDSVFPYGKYCGKKMSDVPAGYLKFIRHGDSHKFALHLEMYCRENKEALRERANQEQIEYEASKQQQRSDPPERAGDVAQDLFKDATADVDVSFDDDDIPF